MSAFDESYQTYTTNSKHTNNNKHRVKLKRVFFPRYVVQMSPFPRLCVREDLNRDSGNLVDPFMRVTS